MMDLDLTMEQVDREIARCIDFLTSNLDADEKVVIGASGGIDSDVVTRLAARALGTCRMKLFTVIQDSMEPRHLENARQLASDVGMRLVEIDLVSMPRAFMASLEKADPDEGFRSDGLLDPARAKCSIRTVVFSSYQDRGFVVVGNGNRSEFETGFFLPLGDGVCHLAPIAHLYKSQVRQLASRLGTRSEVMEQPSSAGFWEGQSDLEDLAYWLFCSGPIGREVDFDDAAEDEVRRIHDVLTTERVDRALLSLSRGRSDEETERESGIPAAVAQRLRRLTVEARKRKLRPFGVRMSDLS